MPNGEEVPNFYSGLHREVPLESGTVFRLKLYKGIGDYGKG